MLKKKVNVAGATSKNPFLSIRKISFHTENKLVILMRLWFSDKSATADVGCCVSNFALESEGNEMVSGMYDYIFVFFF